MGRLASRLPRYPIGTTGVTDVINLEDNEKINFGDALDAAIYWDGTNLIFNPATGETLTINFAAAGTTIYGGITTNTDLILRSNTTDTYSKLMLLGNSEIQLWLAAGANFKFFEETTDFIVFNRSGSTYTTDAATGNGMKFGWSTKTSTGNVVGLEIDASTNLTMGTNFGATGLKINVIAPNGSGLSYGIDVSSLAVDFPVFKVVSDAGNTAGTLTGQIAIDVAGTTYYVYYYTTSTVA